MHAGERTPTAESDLEGTIFTGLLNWDDVRTPWDIKKADLHFTENLIVSKWLGRYYLYGSLQLRWCSNPLGYQKGWSALYWKSNCLTFFQDLMAKVLAASKNKWRVWKGGCVGVWLYYIYVSRGIRSSILIFWSWVTEEKHGKLQPGHLVIETPECRNK